MRMNSRGVVEGEMGAILKGPHIKTPAGNSAMLVEPLQFFRCYFHPRIRKARISKRQAS